MEKDVYGQIDNIERKHWWYQGMYSLCRDQIRCLGVLSKPGAGMRILDIGCGTGFWAKELCLYGTAVAMDNAKEALDICRANGLRDLAMCDAEKLPAKDGSFDMVTALGVIEHIDDDAAFTGEVARVLKSGGHAVFLTSAYMFLWSSHDEFAHHKRRYVRKALEEMIEAAGLKVRRVSYVNSFLFLPILLDRLIMTGRRVRQAETGSPDLFMPPAMINGMLYLFLRLEAALLKAIDLPFGVSLVAIAKKP